MGRNRLTIPTRRSGGCFDCVCGKLVTCKLVVCVLVLPSLLFRPPQNLCFNGLYFIECFVSRFYHY